MTPNEKRTRGKLGRRRLKKLDVEEKHEVVALRTFGDDSDGVEYVVTEQLSTVPFFMPLPRHSLRDEMARELESVEAFLQSKLPSLSPTLIYEVIESDDYFVGYHDRSFGYYADKNIALAVGARVKANRYDASDDAEDLYRHNSDVPIIVRPVIVNEYPQIVLKWDHWFGKWYGKETA